MSRNSPLNDQKGENLILGTHCFRIANIGFAILTIMIVATSFFLTSEPSEIHVNNFDEIDVISSDTLNNRVVNMQEVDTVFVKFDSSQVADTTKNNIITGH